MIIKQATLDEMIETERELVLTADQRYGDYSRHARECCFVLSRCISTINRNGVMCARFYSLLKKHLVLALLSTLRLHKVQAMMNLRQVLEAGAAAAFAIANPEPEHFATPDAQGILDPSSKLTGKRNEWLDKNFPAWFAPIKEKRRRINEYFAHANVVLTGQTFEMNEVASEITTPFFDLQTEFQVKVDLWLTVSTSTDIMILLYAVNKGRDVVKFIQNFEPDLDRLQRASTALATELQSSDHYRQIVEKMQHQSG
jgi:hypothetical protein